MGIKVSDRYVTETCEAADPSDPVVLIALTPTTPDPHDVVEVPTLGNFLMTSRTMVQALAESPAVVGPPEVYSAATRAAFWVVIRAYE